MLMKSSKRVAGVAAFVLLGIAGHALAGPIGDMGQFDQTRVGGYHSGSGGEFTVYDYTNLNNGSYAASTKNIPGYNPSFQTFCIEVNEFTGAAPTYFEVNSKAVDGGDGGPDPDPISKGTAWLYSQFASGVLGGYNYVAGAGRAAEAAKLQQAIWLLEEESLGVATAYYTAAVTQFGSAAAAMSDALVGEYGVYALNNYATKNPLTGELSGKRQDFLYRVPDGGTTALLLGAAMAGLGIVRRRVKQ